MLGAPPPLATRTQWDSSTSALRLPNPPATEGESFSEESDSAGVEPCTTHSRPVRPTLDCLLDLLPSRRSWRAARRYSDRAGCSRRRLRDRRLSGVCRAAASRWAADSSPVVLRVVFPEGWSARQMADRVAEVRRIAIERRGITPRLTAAAYARAVRTARPPEAFRAEAGDSVEGFFSPRSTNSKNRPARRRWSRTNSPPSTNVGGRST